MTVVRTTAPRAAAVLGARTWVRWTIECRLVVMDVTAGAQAYAVANERMDEIGRVIDRFQPASEINKLVAGVNHVSPLLAWFVDSAMRAAVRTEGLVDPTVGVLVPGIDAHDARGPAGQVRSMGRVGVPADRWRDVSVRGTEVVVPPGVRLDLGSTGKAAAADLVARRVASVLGCGVLVGLGGDIATAGGPEHGWQIDVQDAVTDAASVFSLTPGAAVATSSTLHRRWTDGDAEWHHIIDPRTGESAVGPWRTATVVAETCVEANSASTAAIIHGPDAVTWLIQLGFPARLVGQDGNVVTINGFPEEANR